ncbi:MAG: pirin family protein [Pseudobdellovibrionaceae bacterium]
MKKLLLTQRSDTPHWVGDGFPVRSIFTYNDLAKKISPFLLMDYAGPAEFSPTQKRRGVGEHPHRGFETVTIVYAGQVEHRDSAGGGGVIQAGDVQWMTAASGLVHEEMHGKDFSKTGGKFEMVQLWVNLPAKDKMNKPRYQGITSAQIPTASLSKGSLRVIAGDFQGHKGAALTHTPINLWDIRLSAKSENTFKVPVGHTTSVFVLSGKIKIGDSKWIESAELALLETEGEEFTIYAEEDSNVLFLGGEPINEPIVGYGPFVMNTQAEIQQAFHDFQEGKMGRI